MVSLNNKDALDNNDALAKCVHAVQAGKPIKYNEKKKTFERIGFWGRLWRFICPKHANKTDRKVLGLVTGHMRTAFMNKDKVQAEQFAALGTALCSSKRMRKLAPDESAALERYTVGARRVLLGDKDAHYVHPTNLRFFETDKSKVDPRMLGTEQKYAEDHPDFVEFLLNNNIYYQMVRTWATPPASLVLDKDVAGNPLLPFVNASEDMEFDQFTRTWDETSAYLRENDLINEADSTLKEHHMTKWGLLHQHNFMWDKMTPITKIDPPTAPCFQIASYHPEEQLVPGVFNEQGHAGMVFVDKDGYVYSCGFFCHPDSNFYAALKPQQSAIRSPDLYEARVDINWQVLAQDTPPSPGVLPVRWNDGILQFNFADDVPAYPCLQKIFDTWNAAKLTFPEGAERKFIEKRVDVVEKLLQANSKTSEIKKAADQLFGALLAQNIKVKEMTADEKFKAMMGRVHDLQRHTKNAIQTGNWENNALSNMTVEVNGPLPFMMAENNCSHVALYGFGQYGEVMLGMEKTSQVVNTRPSQPGKHLSPVAKSPISRLKWVEISIKSALMGRVMRTLSLLPFVSTLFLGRGKAAPGFTPKTSFKSCLKNAFKSQVTPQKIREKGMAMQFKIKSIFRKCLLMFHNPSGLLPIYKNR